MSNDYRVIDVTIDIPPDVRDNLRSLYSAGVLELGLSEGDHMHSLYTRVFRLAIEECIDTMLSYDMPTARFADFASVWREVGSHESLSDFFGHTIPRPAELCMLLAPLRKLYERSVPDDALAIDRVYVSPALNYVRVRVETWK